MTLRFFFPTALSDHHSAEEKSMILDEFFYRLEEQFLLSPQDYLGVIRNAFMIIEKSRPWKGERILLQLACLVSRIFCIYKHNARYLRQGLKFEFHCSCFKGLVLIYVEWGGEKKGGQSYFRSARGGGYLTFYKEVWGGGVSSFRYILSLVHRPRRARQLKVKTAWNSNAKLYNFVLILLFSFI